MTSRRGLHPRAFCLSSDAMKRRMLSLVGAPLLASLALSGCETPGRTSLLGAGVGAATAAVTGHSALRGAAIGAGAGYLVGRLARHSRERDYERRYAYEHAYEEGYNEGRGGMPYGRRLGGGLVRSPHYPYSTIDVRGIPRGARVVDPSTNRTFINP